jgi:hypothetical protein
VLLSALCMVHCVAGVVLVAVLGLGGSALLDPRIHEYGLAAAVVVGAIGLGMGLRAMATGLRCWAAGWGWR